MLKQWQAWSGRYAKLKPRERILVAVAALALVYLVLDTALVAPTRARQRLVTQDIAQKRQQAEALAAQVRAAKLAQGEDPESANRRRLAELRTRLASQQAAIKELSDGLVPADRMQSVLERLLARNPKLELVEMRALPQERLDATRPAAPEAPKATPADKAAADKAPAAKTAEKPPAEKTDDGSPTLYRYGVELSVRGNYLDLLAYLREIEALPQRLYWQRLDLSVTGYPVSLLRLTLYTVSLDSAWMKV